MSETFYTASLSRTQGRNTWAIIFRHPKRTDPTTGKEGLRVRQSLKTDDEAEAAKLRDDMGALLANPQLWDLGARAQAQALYDQRIVDIFFYKLEGGETDFMALRENMIAGQRLPACALPRHDRRGQDDNAAPVDRHRPCQRALSVNLDREDHGP